MPKLGLNHLSHLRWLINQSEELKMQLFLVRNFWWFEFYLVWLLLFFILLLVGLIFSFRLHIFNKYTMSIMKTLQKVKAKLNKKS